MVIFSIKIANTHVKTETPREVKMAVTMIFTLLPASSGPIQSTLLPKVNMTHFRFRF